MIHVCASPDYSSPVIKLTCVSPEQPCSCFKKPCLEKNSPHLRPRPLMPSPDACRWPLWPRRAPRNICETRLLSVGLWPPLLLLPAFLASLPSPRLCTSVSRALQRTLISLGGLQMVSAVRQNKDVPLSLSCRLVTCSTAWKLAGPFVPLAPTYSLILDIIESNKIEQMGCQVKATCCPFESKEIKYITAISRDCWVISQQLFWNGVMHAMLFCDSFFFYAKQSLVFLRKDRTFDKKHSSRLLEQTEGCIEIKTEWWKLNRWRKWREKALFENTALIWMWADPTGCGPPGFHVFKKISQI